MLAKRHAAALGVFFISIVAVLTVSYMEILNMDRFMVSVEDCSDGCFMPVRDRCLRCEEPAVLTRKRRAPGGAIPIKQVQHLHPSEDYQQVLQSAHHDHQVPQHPHLYAQRMQQQELQEQQRLQMEIEYLKQQLLMAGLPVKQPSGNLYPQYQQQQQQHLHHQQLSAYPPLPQHPGCSRLTACLLQCAKGLVNICKEADTPIRRSQDRHIDIDDEEPMCEDDRPRVMGHAGGDPVNACENTIEATVRGMDAGMEAVHIDISVSKDHELFLWRDHDPRSFTARLRQMNVYGVAGCKPVLAPDTLLPAHTLDWETIESSWFYLHNVKGIPMEVVSFKEWLDELGVDLRRRVDKIWLEFRMPKELLKPSILKAWQLAVSAGVQDKLFFSVNKHSEIIFHNPITLIGGVDVSIDQLSVNQFHGLTKYLEEVQVADPKDNVFILNREDETVYALVVEKVTSEPNLLSQELKSVVDPRELNLKGINFQFKTLTGLVESAAKILESRDRLTRDSCNKHYIQVAAWTVNTLEMANQLKCLHMDYIISDYPERIKRETNCDSKEIYRTVKKVCPQFCPKMYSPVCGTNNKTYSNSCMMRLLSCEEDTQVEVQQSGRCETGDAGEDASHTDIREGKMSDENPVWAIDQFEDLEARSAAAVGRRPTHPSGDSGNSVYRVETTERPRPDFDEKRVCDYTFCKGIEKYSPVCGKDGVTYDNECLLMQTRCKGEEVGLAHEGGCGQDSCTEECSDFERPVCASDRRTYMNECTLRRTTCMEKEDGVELFLWHRGVCGQCAIICTREFKPVCGSDGQSYANRCSMEAQTCQAGTPVRFVHDGNC